MTIKIYVGDTEEALLEKISEVWNTYLKMERLPRENTGEFMAGIHKLESLIVVRAYLRKDMEKESDNAIS